MDTKTRQQRRHRGVDRVALLVWTILVVIALYALIVN